MGFVYFWRRLLDLFVGLSGGPDADLLTGLCVTPSWAVMLCEEARFVTPVVGSLLPAPRRRESLLF